MQNFLNLEVAQIIKEYRLENAWEVVQIFSKSYDTTTYVMKEADRHDWEYLYKDHETPHEIRGRQDVTDRLEQAEDIEKAEYVGYWTGVVKNTTPVTEGGGILITTFKESEEKKPIYKTIIDVNNNFLPGAKKNGYGI